MTNDESVHWSEQVEATDRPTVHDRAEQLAAAPVLGVVAQRLADVSPAWARVTIDPATAPTDAPAGLTRDRAIGVESIREGWLLHRNASRLAADASPDLALLVGDWCYAAGLCEIADHGSLDDVAHLAALVADVSARATETVDELAPRWDETVEAMRNG
jgi:hypothetical protein